MSWNTSRVPLLNVHFFSHWHHVLCDISSFLWQPLSSMISISLQLTSCGSLCRISHRQQCPHSHSQLFLPSLHLHCHFTSSMIASHFFLHSHLLGLTPSFNDQLLGKATWVITEREGGNTTAHFAVCAWPDRQTLSKEWCDWSLFRLHICLWLCSTCYLCNALQTEELAAKSVLQAIIHS